VAAGRRSARLEETFRLYRHQQRRRHLQLHLPGLERRARVGAV